SLGGIQQACLNYRSIAKNIATLGFNPGQRDEIYCPFVPPALNSIPRHANIAWNTQHNSQWVKWVPQRNIDPNYKCQRAEYPFYRFLGPPNSDNLQYVRL